MSFDPFQPFAANGFLPDLLPIAPPGAHLSPYGNLTPDHLGKTPAIPTEDGYVGYTAWPVSITTTDKLKEWRGATNGSGPPNVGLNARGLHALDVDTADPKFARAAYDVMMRLIPDAMRCVGIRIGRAPGFLVPFQPETPHRKSRLRFQDQAGAKSAIELLGVGQQYVIAGTHPSGKPYRWQPVPGGMVLPQQVKSKIVTLSDDRIAALLAEFQSEIEARGYAIFRPAKARLSGGASDSQPGSESLSAPSLEAVAAALAALPNRPANKRDYDEWITVCHAVIGATAKSAEGRDLWLAWSAQWDESAAGEANADRRWQGIVLGQVGIGWPWLREQASAENADFARAIAAEDFAAPEPEPAPTRDGGLFDVPQQDHPTAEEIDAAIELLEPRDGKAVAGVVKLMARSRISAIEVEAYCKTLKGLTGIGLSTLKQQYKNYAVELRRDSPDVGRNLAKQAHKRFGVGRIAFYRRVWWRFRDGYWQFTDSQEIEKALGWLIDKDSMLLIGANGQQQHAHSMIKAAAAALAADCHDVLMARETPAFQRHTMINCRNGTLTVRADGRHELKPHDPADCFLYQMPVDYDPLADGKLYDTALTELMSESAYALRKGCETWPADKEAIDRAQAQSGTPTGLTGGRIGWRTGNSYHAIDVADNCRMVNEILGYTLVPWRGARAMVIFKGDGSNGKSALLQAVLSLIQPLVASITLDQLNSQFAMSEFENKQVCLVDETDEKAVRDDKLKTLVENKTFNTDVKYGGWRAIALNCVPIFCTNGHFRTTDTSDGMQGRMIFVPLNRKYTAADRARNPWARLLSDESEKSAMLNRLVDGLTDVLQHNEIRRSKSSLHAFQEWQSRNKPEANFIQDWCLEDRPDGTKAQGDTLANLYAAYRVWYQTNFNEVRYARGLHNFSDVLQQMRFEKYEGSGQIRFRDLWVNPAKINFTDYSGTEFEPLINPSG